LAGSRLGYRASAQRRPSVRLATLSIPAGLAWAFAPTPCAVNCHGQPRPRSGLGKRHMRPMISRSSSSIWSTAQPSGSMGSPLSINLTTGAVLGDTIAEKLKRAACTSLVRRLRISRGMVICPLVKATQWGRMVEAACLFDHRPKAFGEVIDGRGHVGFGQPRVARAVDQRMAAVGTSSEVQADAGKGIVGNRVGNLKQPAAIAPIPDEFPLEACGPPRLPSSSGPSFAHRSTVVSGFQEIGSKRVLTHVWR